jgi:methionine aminopeptidase
VRRHANQRGVSGYQEDPKTILTSVNHVVSCVIPSPSKILMWGDIVNIDVAISLADTALDSWQRHPSGLRNAA